jgi:drug/metabolite transporter (DMT)-like permease
MTLHPSLPAIGLAVAGFTSWVFSDTLMKLASEADLPPHEVVAFLCLFGAVMMLVKGAAQGSVTALWPRQPARQLGRIVAALGCTLANTVALKHLPLTVFYMAVFTAPMVISALAAVFLRERLTAAQVIAIIAGFAGVVVAVDPLNAKMQGGWSQGDWIGYAAVFISVLCFSASAVWLRVLAQTETTDSLAFFSGVAGMAVCGGLMAWHAVPVSISMLLILLAMAVFTLIGQLCNYTAMRLATAATVSQFHYTQIVAGAALGFLIWHEVPDLHTVLGAAIIIGSGLYIAARGRTESGSEADAGLLRRRLHPGAADDRRGLRRGEICQERPRRPGICRDGVDGSGEHRRLLDPSGQRAEIVDALHGEQLADLLETDVGIAARHDLADRHVGDGRDDLRPELFGEAPIRDEALDVNAARAGGIGDLSG